MNLLGFDFGRRAALGAARSRCQTPEKVRANTMTMKERIRVHAEIERKNLENIKNWKEENEDGKHEEVSLQRREACA